MPNKRIKIKDTVTILNIVDKAVQIKASEDIYNTLLVSKWQKIKGYREKFFMTYELKLEHSKSFVFTRQTLVKHKNEIDSLIQRLLSFVVYNY